MYVPNAFSIQDRRQIDAFIASNSFGMLVTNVEGRPVATHLPLLLEADNGTNGTLWGHIARANDQWRTGDVDALAVFAGPHAYISPTYYQVERTVPTWNYVAVHVSGQVSYFEDEASLREVLRRTVDKYEQPRTPPWRWDEETEFAGRMLRDIVGLRMTIERIDAKWKLNQNHPKERRERVIVALEQEGGEMNREVASLMRATF